jgi:hypothetical protein
MGAKGRTLLAEAFKVPVFHGCKRVRMSACNEQRQKGLHGTASISAKSR